VLRVRAAGDLAGVGVSPEAILAVLLGLPLWQGDRDDTDEARRALLEPVAVAISAASDDRQVVAAVITQGLRESRYARAVIENRCHEMPAGARCDEDSCGNPRARGPWQLWHRACPSAYEFGAGTPESLAAEAKCIARLWRGGFRRCQGLHPAGDVAGAFAALRGGASCQSRTAGERARTMQTVWLRLQPSESN
jgi:hypothetical protein